MRCDLHMQTFWPPPPANHDDRPPLQHMHARPSKSGVALPSFRSKSNLSIAPSQIDLVLMSIVPEFEHKIRSSRKPAHTHSFAISSLVFGSFGRSFLLKSLIVPRSHIHITMPSPIRVPIHQKLNNISSPTATAEEDANDAIAAYLTPLLVKHERHQPLVYEDLLESYEVAQAVAASSSANKNIEAQQEVRHLHESQLQAYEAYARMELTKLAENYECPSIEEGESMPAYIERIVQSFKDEYQPFMGWSVSDSLMEEVFWSKVKLGARKAYFKLKGQSIEKDKTAKTDGQTTDKVNAFEAAALGALVSKTGSQDADSGNAKEEKGGDDEENDMTDDDGEDGDGEKEEDGEEEDAEDDDVVEEDNEDDEIEDDENGEEANAEHRADAAVEDNGTSMVPAKTPTTTKKRRRLPNGPLGGGGAGSATDGGKKQQPAKKQKTGKGGTGDTTGAGAGRGSTGGRGKGSKAGRGAGGGRGTRNRNRKKGTGSGADGIA